MKKLSVGIMILTVFALLVMSHWASAQQIDPLKPGQTSITPPPKLDPNLGTLSQIKVQPPPVVKENNNVAPVVPILPVAAPSLEPCPTCHGKGTIVCPGCGGSGIAGRTTINGQPAAYGCERCGGVRGDPMQGTGRPGTGRIICPTCGGSKAIGTTTANPVGNKTRSTCSCCGSGCICAFDSCGTNGAASCACGGIDCSCTGSHCPKFGTVSDCTGFVIWDSDHKKHCNANRKP
jgi:hypothetical protein